MRGGNVENHTKEEETAREECAYLGTAFADVDAIRLTCSGAWLRGEFGTPRSYKVHYQLIGGKDYEETDLS